MLIYAHLPHQPAPEPVEASRLGDLVAQLSALLSILSVLIVAANL